MKENGDNVIITGAGSGIGRATALLFAHQGDTVVVSDINEAQGNETVGLIKESGGNAVFVKCDVSKKEQVTHLVSSCVSEFGDLDVMINNAGIGRELCFFHEITDEHYEQIMSVNVTGVFYCMRAALSVMHQQSYGKIVNVSSLAGIGSAPRMGAYAASKHAVTGMTKTAASEYGKYNIRVNAVCPTIIKTPMGDAYLSENDPAMEMIRHSIPLKRFGEAKEVAETIVWLSSDRSSYINGETIRVDGGMRA